ncbi:UbiA family prenyltransferase [Candidatus Woesearchaeota archaeon]|nr:UbiA family prenyltransferase [Candidatus Woesearchaeota archaeon]
MGLSKERIIIYLVFLVYIFFGLLYGFIINSFADKEDDVRTGKNMMFNTSSKKMIYSLVIISGIFTLIIPFLFFDMYIAFIGLAYLFFATFYSLKPLRFKERGLLGVIVSATTVGTLPFTMFIYIVHAPFILGIFLMFWLFLPAFISDVIHHIEDFNNDRLTRTDTWVQRIGLKKSYAVLRYSIYLMFVSCFFPLFLFNIYNGLLICLVLLTISVWNFLEDLLYPAQQSLH